MFISQFPACFTWFLFSKKSTFWSQMVNGCIPTQKPDNRISCQLLLDPIWPQKVTSHLHSFYIFSHLLTTMSIVPWEFCSPEACWWLPSPGSCHWPGPGGHQTPAGTQSSASARPRVPPRTSRTADCLQHKDLLPIVSRYQSNFHPHTDFVHEDDAGLTLPGRREQGPHQLLSLPDELAGEA